MANSGEKLWRDSIIWSIKKKLNHQGNLSPQQNYPQDGRGFSLGRRRSRDVGRRLHCNREHQPFLCFITAIWGSFSQKQSGQRSLGLILRWVYRSPWARGLVGQSDVLTLSVSSAENRNDNPFRDFDWERSLNLVTYFLALRKGEEKKNPHTPFWEEGAEKRHMLNIQCTQDTLVCTFWIETEQVL